MKRRYLVGTFFLALLLCIYFHPVFLENRIFAERDLPVFFYPNILFWLNSVREGELPLWNPYVMCGEPCLANVQPGCLYPPSILYFMLPDDIAFNISIVLHFFLAGVFTFILMKELQSSDQGAAIASLLFVFGGYLLSVQNVLSTLLSVTWFPLVLSLFLRGMRRSSWRCSFSTAAALYCMFSAGGMEIFIMTCAILTGVACVPAVYRYRTSSFPFGKRLLYAVLTYIVCATIGAAQILPFLELVGQSVRSGGIRFDEAVTWSLAPKNLLYLFVPDVFWRGQQYYWQDQSWLKTIYTGTFPFMLTLFFFLKGPAGRKVFVTAVSGIALFLALGGHNPFYRYLFEWLPVLKTIRYPVKFFFPVVFFLCIAAGLGWDSFRHGLDEKRIRRAAFLLFFLFGFLFSLLYLFLSLNPELFWHNIFGAKLFRESALPQHAIAHNILRCMLFSILGATILYLIARKKRLRPFGFYAVVALVLVDLFAGNYGFYVTVKRETLHGITGNMEIVINDEEICRFFVPWDVIKSSIPFNGYDDFLWQQKDFLTGNMMAVHRRFSTFGFPVLMLKHYYNFFAVPYNSPLPDSTSLLNMLNVKYVLWPHELNRPGYELVRKDRFYLYKNNNRLPRAVLVPDYKVVTDGKELYEAMTSPTFNPAETVFLDSPPNFGRPQESDTPSQGIPPSADAVTIREYHNTTITLDVKSSGNRILFLSETFYPGWKAFIDGCPVRIHRANYAFRAIAVSPGRHKVVFAYCPATFRIGVLISLIGIAVTLFALFIPRIPCLHRSAATALRLQ